MCNHSFIKQGYDAPMLKTSLHTFYDRQCDVVAPYDISISKGKAKLTSQQTNNISQQPENWETAMALTWYRYFQRNCGLIQILRRQTSRFHDG